VSESRVVYEVVLDIPVGVTLSASAADHQWWSHVEGIYETLDGAKAAIEKALAENFRMRGIDQICTMTRGPRHELEVTAHRWMPPDFHVAKVSLR
jgi:hypothetical protein